MRDWSAAAKAEVANVIGNLDSWYFRANEFTGSFKLVYDKEPLLGYTRASYDMANKNDFLCQGKLQVSLDDVAFALHSETTLDFRSVQAQLYPRSFLDAAVLRVLEGPTSEDSYRFTGVKWEAHGSLGSGLISARDYVYFEHLSKTRDAQGRTVVVQYVESLDLSAHELRDHGLRLTRVGTFAISTFRSDLALGGVVYQSAGSVGVSKHTPSWSGAMKGLPHSFGAVLNLSALADARTIASLGGLRKLSQQRRQEAIEKKACNVCDRKFNVLTRTRHKCRSCGRASCRSCIVPLKFFNELSPHSPKDNVAILSGRFCVKCVMNYRELRRNGSTSPSESGPESSSLVDSTSIWSDTASGACYSADEAPVTDSSSSESVLNEPEVNMMRGDTTTEHMHSHLVNPILNPEHKARASADAIPVAYSPPSPVERWSADAVSSDRRMHPNNWNSCAPEPVPAKSVPSRRSMPVVVSTADAFAMMSESIAAQSALLRKLRSTMSVATGGCSVPVSAPEASPSSRSRSSPPSIQSANDRFEILS
ncbi:hypothetical protein PybrP1_003861 [[Pythium] brassicae (nom. inval.)]|nr:hypothetical protein PybrP1_003861 [[Pythium] brassicae (nom. inval.)]